MIEGVLAGGEVLGVMSSTRVRTNRVNTATAFDEQRALHIPRCMFKGRQSCDLFRMGCETNDQTRNLIRSEMVEDVTGNQEDFMCEHVDSKRAAHPTALTAGQLHISLLNDLSIEPI